MAKKHSQDVYLESSIAKFHAKQAYIYQTK